MVVVGDLMLDVVLAPTVPLAGGTDVPGRVTLVQGGSAANTARWLARLGARSTLVAAVGRDGAGRALVAALRDDGVTARVSRVGAVHTGRIGVVVGLDGERSFVADRGAADRLDPSDLKPAWFDRAAAIHLPIYSLLGEPLGAAGQRAVELGRAAGAAVSVDLASSGPLLANGRVAARTLIERVAPDLLFATAVEAEALLGVRDPEGLLDLADIAVVKRGPKGATVLTRLGPARSRFDIATEHLPATDTTGAGDAFDAGFLVGWFAGRAAGRSLAASLRRAALAGHRAAARQIAGPRPGLTLV
jgi:sugar/nucleoside kinase (ribokinase family)